MTFFTILISIVIYYMMVIEVVVGVTIRVISSIILSLINLSRMVPRDKIHVGYVPK